jgi:hypothetical protein
MGRDGEADSASTVIGSVAIGDDSTGSGALADKRHGKGSQCGEASAFPSPGQTPEIVKSIEKSI